MGKEKEENKIVCEKCMRKIEDDEPRVTYKEHIPKNKKVLIELNFHQQCWINHYNESMDKKIRAYSSQMMKTALPLVKNFMENRI